MLADTPMEHWENGSPPWTRTTTTRLTGGHAALTSAGNGSSARYRAAVSRLSGGCSAIYHWKRMAGAGIEPAHGRRMRPLPFLLATPRLENGGLCR